MIRRLLAASASALLLATPAAAQSGGNGFAPDRLARIDKLMQQYVDSSRISGAVGLVLRDGKVVYERAVGYAVRSWTSDTPIITRSCCMAMAWASSE